MIDAKALLEGTTPGPWDWIVSHDYGYSSLWSENAKRGVVAPGGQNDGDSPIVWIGEEMLPQDAALLAAAPQLARDNIRLREALMLIRALLVSYGGKPSPAGDAFKVVDAAIKGTSDE